MMRKSFLVFGFLMILSLFGPNVAESCCRCRTGCCCYYVASPCYCCTPTCSWSCCDPCCGWSCCYSRCAACRCYTVVPSQGLSGCSACAPAAPSSGGASLKPVPEKAAVPQSR
jgi:hypothetical protein